MRRQMITSLVAASALVLGLHAATPVSQAADGPSINATCTVDPKVLYRSGATMYSAHTIRCTSTVNSITVYGYLNGPNTARSNSRVCFNTSECTTNNSAPYVRGLWSNQTHGSVDGIPYATQTTTIYFQSN